MSFHRLLLYMVPVLCLVGASAQSPVFQLIPDAASGTVTRSLPGAFSASDHPEWSLEMDLSKNQLSVDASLLRLTNESKETWLRAHVIQHAESEFLEFLLYTDYKSEPLSVGLPVKLLSQPAPGRLLLRYQRTHLCLFYDGVLVDEEWPVGTIQTGKNPSIEVNAPVAKVLVWNQPLSDTAIANMNGGPAKVTARTNAVLGPEPQYVQYSRPRGYNTNAGDAMPYYHDGTFHLFFLFDRRQHHSKWGLGAHQWAHISSTDLVHWKHYPVALSIDEPWEGSICTGSIFFHKGTYYAHYATRMPDRSEHLAVATSTDNIHFKKHLPTPFAEPASPFVHGPNRDPFIFEANDEYHMLVTAAIPKADGKGTEGALEHLVSKDLTSWKPLAEPFLLSGSDQQPECSDLFKWKGWYYLIYSLGGTTHYRMAKDPLGPWTTPASDILDGPEAIVMKAAQFKDDRMLLVGFVQHDNHYGGDLVFRELVQMPDGSLGTTDPKEMQLPAGKTEKVADLHLSKGSEARLNNAGSNTRVTAVITPNADSSFGIELGPTSQTSSERLTFDSKAGTVIWTDSDGKPAHGMLDHVTDLSGPVKIELVLHDTLADLSINGHRTLIHRLRTAPHEGVSLFTMGDGLSATKIAVSSLQ